jgi:hypothetical protein
MRKTQMAGRRPSDRIAVRAETAGTALRLQGPAARRTMTERRVKPVPADRRGATMDYQMGFTSGPSN